MPQTNNTERLFEMLQQIIDGLNAMQNNSGRSDSLDSPFLALFNEKISPTKAAKAQ